MRSATWCSSSSSGWATRSGRWRWLIDAAIAVYTGFSIWAWFEFGAPNPDGLGYTAKALEATLIVFLAIHAWYVTRRAPGNEQRAKRESNGFQRTRPERVRI